ncbi:hypothetical protein Pfo_000453 [Paulownia fortunei]|nr:hypothetical protein Pfo_000453 [Paulownia fortunei]
MDTAINVPVEAQVLDSPDKITGAQDGMTSFSKMENRSVPSKNVQDLKKCTSDSHAQTQGPELPFQAAPPCSEEREANVVSNISAHRPEDAGSGNAQTCEHRTGSSIHSMPMVALVDDKSFENNEEMVPILKAIFTKYGDIAKESTFSMESRSCLLEMVCRIYKRLEGSKFMQLTPLELQSMLGQIGDLELVKVEVGWLRERLNQISKARQLCEAVETYEKELETCMAAVEKLHQRLQQEKEELAAALTVVDEIKNFDGSLVHGLL